MIQGAGATPDGGNKSLGRMGRGRGREEVGGRREEGGGGGRRGGGRGEGRRLPQDSID